MLKRVYNNYNNIILNLIFLLPFFDIYRALIGNKFELFGISFVEIFNIIFSFAIFSLLLIKAKKENKKLFTIKNILLIVLIIIYIIMHGIYLLSLKDLQYLHTTISLPIECYYVFRTCVLPLIVLFVYMNSNNNPLMVTSTLSKFNLILSIIIVITNILGIALVAYSSDYEGIVQIKGNIFTWFTNMDTKSIDLYTSRGLFYSTNQVSAITGALLFISAFYTMKKNEFKYYFSFFIKVIAAIMLSTKTAFFAIFLSIISMLIYNSILYITQRKCELNKKCWLFIIYIIFVLVMYNYSPIKYKLEGYISNINNNNNIEIYNDTNSDKKCKVYDRNGVTDKTPLSELIKKDILTNDEKEYLVNYLTKCPNVFNVHKDFVKLYPVSENFTYWKKMLKQPISILTDYRKFKYSIYNDFIKRHNNKLDRLFGIGYSSNFPYLEKDFIGQYVWIGLLGVLLLMGPYMLIILKSIFKLLYDFRNNFKSNTVSLLLATLFMLAASITAGHVFGIFMPSTILAFIISGLYSSVNKKIELREDKITILALHLGIGGTEKYLSSLCKMLEDNYKIEVISTYKVMDKPGFEFSDKIDIKYLINDYPHKEEFKLALRNKNIILIIKYGFSLFKILCLKFIKNILYIKKIDSRYIITTRYFHNKLVSKYKNNDIIAIATEHNYHNNDNKYIKKVIKSCKNINYFVVVSEELEEFYTKKFKDYNMNTKCIYIPNVIDNIPKYTKKEKINNRLVSIGRLVYEKGFDDLVDIINIVKRSIPNIKLDIYGDGELKEKLSNKINKLELNNNINLCGFCPFEEISKNLINYDLYLMTSYTESFGLVLIEAMSNSLACLAFDCASGARKILKDDNGILISNRDKEKYANKIIDLLKNIKNINKISKKGYESIKKYDISVVKKEWIKLIKSEVKKNV